MIKAFQISDLEKIFINATKKVEKICKKRQIDFDGLIESDVSVEGLSSSEREHYFFGRYQVKGTQKDYTIHIGYNADEGFYFIACQCDGALQTVESKPCYHGFLAWKKHQAIQDALEANN